MRTHRRWALLDFPRRPHRLAQLTRAQHLAAARIEPAIFGTRGCVLMDLLFSCPSGSAVVPFIEIHGEMLDQRECSPFIWPLAYAGNTLDPAQVQEIEDLLLPWIESLAFTGALNEEVVRVFDEDTRPVFEIARRHAFLGAAKYRDVFDAAGPYVFASRLSAEMSVGIRDPLGATGAALLARVAETVRADLESPQANVAARAWFDRDIFGEAPASCDVGIGNGFAAPVEIDLHAQRGERIVPVTPVPMDVTVSFDPEDAPPARAFGVQIALHPHLRPVREVAPASVGGSSGRVLLLMRDEFARAPDADTDQAALLADRLRAEGFVVDVRAASHCDPEAYDLVHAIDAAYPEQLLEPLRRARDAGKPIVVGSSASREGEAAWGAAMVPQILRASRDETELGDHLRLFAARHLQTAEIGLQAQPFAGYAAVLAEVMQLAGAVLDPQTMQFVAPLEPAGTVAAAAGTGEFVLCHAPIHPRCNQFMLLRGAARAGLPLVLAGPVVDLEYAGHLKAYAPPGTIFAGEPDPAVRAALYRRARVYADVAWFGLGSGRLAAAAAAGCSVLARPQADPASEESIAAMLLTAWRSPAPVWAGGDPLPSVVRAYDRAAQNTAVHA